MMIRKCTRPIKRRPGYSVEHESWFIPLTQDVIALVDADMVPVLSQYNWFAKVAYRQWIAARNLNTQPVNGLASPRRNFSMHAQIMAPLRGEIVDHKNHAPVTEKLIDNRRSNLRLATRRQNVQNRRKLTKGTSKYKGVSWATRQKKWYAAIRHKRSLHHLGYHKTEEDAARAYDAEAQKLFGEFALTNKQMGLLS